MTNQEIQARSAEKVKQVLDLMGVLHLKVEVRERMNLRTGFITREVFWLDNEGYATDTDPEVAPKAQELPPDVQEMTLPAPEVAPATPEVAPAGPTGETA